MKIAVLSDIHGNSVALKAVIRELKKKKITECIILGDFIGYYYHPDEVIRLLLNNQLSISAVRGNHERMMQKVLTGELMVRDITNKYGHGLEFAKNQMDDRILHRIISLPDKIIVKKDGIKICVSHGTPNNPDQYVYPDTKISEFEFGDIRTDFILMGHTHYPMIRYYRNMIIVNPGSVGQARNYGGVANWCTINSKNSIVTMYHTPYQIDGLLVECSKYDPALSYLQDVLKRR